MKREMISADPRMAAWLRSLVTRSPRLAIRSQFSRDLMSDIGLEFFARNAVVAPSPGR